MRHQCPLVDPTCPAPPSTPETVVNWRGGALVHSWLVPNAMKAARCRNMSRGWYQPEFKSRGMWEDLRTRTTQALVIRPECGDPPCEPDPHDFRDKGPLQLWKTPFKHGGLGSRLLVAASVAGAAIGLRAAHAARAA